MENKPLVPWQDGWECRETRLFNELDLPHLYSAMIVIGSILLGGLMLIGSCRVVHAYPSGECTSHDQFYKNIPFTAEEFHGPVHNAAEFAKEVKGQLIKEKDEDRWYVIWSPDVATPATQFTCLRITEEK